MAVVAVFVVTRLVPGWTGLGVGLGAAVALHRWLRTATSRATVQRRERVLADLALAVDLLVACLAAGRPPGQALTEVASAVRGPLGDDLRRCASRLDLGTDPAQVWRDLAGDEALAPLGRALARSARTGSSITLALARCSQDVRRDRRAAAVTHARKVGVKASAPLGACFLPAFLVVGILPTVVASFSLLHL
ncbi:MAG: type II secretion system F family protein [Nocardioidaceae bacterium]